MITLNIPSKLLWFIPMQELLMDEDVKSEVVKAKSCYDLSEPSCHSFQPYDPTLYTTC